MTTTLPTAPLSCAERERFEVLRLLGTGGMASVYEVLDRVSQQRVALKRLHETTDPARQRRMIELFEREFYTLSQIKHPNVVEAYDYGIDKAGAYYTMELLDGGELQSLARLPYKHACRIARDICSALSLLHSRRLVYRDLNPRNVHCTTQGTSKLIDFGAIVGMGPCPQVVGTPAYCAPEMVDSQPLDARTDLYSLGATLYFALTGQHAYPAKTFAQLRQFWAGPLARPSALAPDIPASLDSLVMSLLSLDPSARPANANELMEQLAALTDQTFDEQLRVVQAYLSTPNLVGRETQLAHMRAQLQRALAGHGSAQWITSGSGMGRSRFLAACSLEAKMAGALVARAAGSEADGDYVVMRALAESLFEAAPELAQRSAQAHRETLAQLLPELVETQPGAASPKPERAQMLAAVRDWFTTVARSQALMIAVDDFHRVDEASAACLAWISHESSKWPVLVAVTCEPGDHVVAPAALKLFENNAVAVPLENLDVADTETLLGSVFGGVQHVQLVARKLHAIAAGNPRDTMRLAQHLVDRGLARYRSGGWLLPSNFDEGELPESMNQATLLEFGMLGPSARQLARLLSIASDRALSFDECAKAFPDLPAKSVHDCLQELLRMEFARLEGGLFTVAHRGLHAALRHGSDQADMNRAHHALAEIFAARGNEGFRQAKHSLRAGDTARGVDVLIAFARQTQPRTDNDPGEYVQLVASLPDDWLDVCEAAIMGCRQLGRVRTDLFQLRYRLTSLLNVMAAPIAASHVHLLALIRQLCEDSGLDDYADLDAGIDPGERLKQALGAAKQRFDANPVENRGVEPSLAIRALVRAQLQAAGVIALAIDYPLATVLPSIAPLTPLSPAFGVMEKVIGAVAARVAGRQEHAREVYQQVLERTAQPDLAGLDTSNHRFLRYGIMYGLAVIEAGMGLSSCLAWAQKLEGEPLHAVNALQVQMLYELWLGRVPEADQVRARIELRRIESSSRQMADGTHLVWQTIAHAYSDDLTHLKQVIEDLRLFARRYPGWTRVVAYALAEYHRARGNLASAHEHVTTALRNMAAGTHQIWPHAAGLQVTILTDLGRADEAATLGDRYLLAGAAADLGYLTNYIRMPLAMAHARLGQHERASELAEHALRVFIDLGTSGLNLVIAYETRSRVALLASHRADYSRFAARCAEECARTGGRVLRAKHDRLVWAANASLLAPAEATAEPLPLSTVESMLRSVFDDAVQPRARAQQALQLLLSNSGAVEGVLYLIGERGLEPAAQVGSPSTALELITRVRDFIDVELAERGIVTATLLGAESSNGLTTCVGPQRLVLLSHQTSAGLAVTGVVALLSRPGMPFHPPGTLAARLSRMLAEAGDVVPLMSA